MLLRCLIAASAGLGLTAAFEPIGLAVTMPFCLAALALALRGVRLRSAWLIGLAHGVAFHFSLLWWMRSVGTDAWLGLASTEAVFSVVLGLWWAALSRVRWWPWWMAVAWVVVETWRSTFPFSGMPWGRLSYAVAGTPWQWDLPWLSMTGVSLLIALTGTSLAWLVSGGWRRRSQAALLIACLVGVTVLPTLVPPTSSGGDPVTIAVVQPDLPGDGTDVIAVHRQVTAANVALTQRLAEQVRAGDQPQPSLVLWSENATAIDAFNDPSTRASIDAAAEAIGVPIVVGLMVDGPTDQDVLNQGVVWRPGLGGGDRFTKRHPVPYGEYIPFRDTLLPSDYGSLRLISRDMMRGTSDQPLSVGGLKVADLICFDVAYDDALYGQVSRGAEVVVVQTSNVMFSRTHQLDQQFEITRLRAVEAGRWTAVAALNGISGVISPDGDVRSSVGARQQGVIVAQVHPSQHLTLAVRMGRWPARVLFLLGLLQLLCAGVTYHSRRRSGGAGRTPIQEGTV